MNSLVPLQKVEEPSSFEEAAGLKEWGDERGDFRLNTLNQNETWELVPLPEGVKPIELSRSV